MNQTIENTYYEEIEVDGHKKFKCLLCSRLLSRKQRVEDHLKSIHSIEFRKRKYKLYLADETLKVPKQTRHYQNRKSKKSSSQAIVINDTYTSSSAGLYLPSNTEHWSSCSQFRDQAAFPSEDCSTVSVEQMYVDMDCMHGTDSEIDNITVPRNSCEIANTTTNNRVQEDESGTSSSSDSDDYSDDESGINSSTSEGDYSDYDNCNSDEETTSAPRLSSYESACMALLSFITRHRLTNEAGRDLIELIKVACPESEVFNSMSHSSMREICGNCKINVYDVCEKCLGLFPFEERNLNVCSTPDCGGYRYKGTKEQQVKKLPKCSFYTIDIKRQLKELLERSGIWQTIQDRIKKRGKDVITDIMDEKFYMELCKEGQFLSCTDNISLIFNTDGAPLYSSSSVSLWPVFLAVNELPSPDRFSKQNMLMWGIWQGKGKPPFNTYFEPFTTEMTALYDTGVDIQVDPSQIIKVKAAVLLGTTDLQGKAYLLDMTQHNGENGCLTCEEPGCVVKQGKGHSRCYPYRPSSEAAPKRTTSSFLENALEAHRSKNKYIMGVGDVTSLALMPWFDIVLGMVPDYMHGCLLGVTKGLLNKWFSPKNCKKPYFIGKKIGKINKRFLKMRPPDFVSRLPRNLEKHYKNFKASELQSWLLYYSIPCLLGYLPDKYLRHFCHLSEGIYILLGDEILQSSLSRARDLLNTFYKEFQELYGDGSCGLNVHNTGAHLVDYVEGWGPLWAWSNFGFEDMNGTILDFAHGTGNVCRQLLWMLHAQSRLRSDVEIMEAGMLKDFVTRMLSTKREVKNLKTAVGCSLAGGTSKLSGLSPSLNEKVERMGQGTSKFKVLRIMRNGQIFCSKSWKRMVKRNSSVVLLCSGKIAEIQFFIWIKESDKVLAVFQEICVDEQKVFLFESAGHHILNMKPISSELQVSDVEDIQEKVVLMGDNEQCLFISRAPNFCGVCG